MGRFDDLILWSQSSRGWGRRLLTEGQPGLNSKTVSGNRNKTNSSTLPQSWHCGRRTHQPLSSGWITLGVSIVGCCFLRLSLYFICVCWARPWFCSLELVVSPLLPKAGIRSICHHTELNLFFFSYSPIHFCIFSLRRQSRLSSKYVPSSPLGWFPRRQIGP